MIKRAILITVAILIASALTAKTNNGTAKDSTTRKMAFSGYTGGMMIHTGYVSSDKFNYITSEGTAIVPGQAKGVPVGVGGALKFGFGKHFRIGTEGYVSTLKYGTHKSHSSTGWGGLLFDWIWSKNKWSWFIGGTVGGGRVRNIALLGEMHNDLIIEDNNTSYRSYSFMALVPFIGAEYALTSKIHLIMKVDYLFNVCNRQKDFVTGPRIYLGFMFCHPREHKHKK